MHGRTTASFGQLYWAVSCALAESVGVNVPGSSACGCTTVSTGGSGATCTSAIVSLFPLETGELPMCHAVTSFSHRLVRENSSTVGEERRRLLATFISVDRTQSHNEAKLATRGGGIRRFPSAPFDPGLIRLRSVSGHMLPSIMRFCNVREYTVLMAANVDTSYRRWTSEAYSGLGGVHQSRTNVSSAECREVKCSL